VLQNQYKKILEKENIIHLTHCTYKMALKCQKKKVAKNTSDSMVEPLYQNASQSLITSWIDMKFEPYKLD